MEKLDILMQRIDKFNKDREWDQFHSPVNLAKSISIESGELLECFQWSNDKFELEDVKEEIADVMNYCLQMCNVLGLDPIEVINKKMDLTEKKYPVEKAKGVSTKYNKL
jgi:NTP pyrophosphatase (non-canonical NTP hydrolase)